MAAEHDDDSEVDDDANEDREGTDQRDIRRFDGETIPCPDCGRQIYPEAFRCPHCKSLLTDEERTGSHRRPLWFRITAWICILAFTWWMIYVIWYFLAHWQQFQWWQS